MYSREHKEHKERQEKICHLEIDHQSQAKRSVSQCRSTFYVGPVINIHNAVNRYLPDELTNLVISYYSLDGYKIEILQQLARTDDQNNQTVIDAQARLGWVYYWGGNVKSDKVEAAKWLRLARRRQDLPAGQFALGLCHWWGIDMRQSITTAIACFRKAVVAGYAPAQHILGHCYGNGQGVPRNLEEAVRLYGLAAAQGHAFAQINLGYCYRKGLGVAKKPKEAVRLYGLTAKWLALAQYNLGDCYEKGEGVAKNMQEAIKWYQMAAKQGLAAAERHLKQLGVPLEITDRKSAKTQDTRDWTCAIS